MKKNLLLVFLVIALVSLAVAEGTRQWKETGYDDFEKGTARGIAISSTGQIELAPAFKAIYTSPSSFIWSIAADKDGVVYAATGAPARVYRVTPDGKSTVIFEPKELQVQSIALGAGWGCLRGHLAGRQGVSNHAQTGRHGGGPGVRRGDFLRPKNQVHLGHGV